MTNEEWKALKKEKGMKIYVPKFYKNHSLRIPSKCEEYTDIHEAILRDRLEKQKEASRQLVAELKKLREENVKLCRECIVLRHGEQGQEAEDEQKERSAKV